MQKQMVFWLLAKRLWKLLLFCLPQSSTGEGEKWGKNALVVLRKYIETRFIAGRDLGLHASTVLFEIVESHLSCLQHLCSHQKASSVSWQFFPVSDSSHLHHSLQKERSLYKIHKLFTWILFHITQAGCRPLKTVLRVKAGHSLYQRQAHFGGVFPLTSNVCSHVQFNSEAFHTGTIFHHLQDHLSCISIVQCNRSCLRWKDVYTDPFAPCIL